MTESSACVTTGNSGTLRGQGLADSHCNGCWPLHSLSFSATHTLAYYLTLPQHMVGTEASETVSQDKPFLPCMPRLAQAFCNSIGNLLNMLSQTEIPLPTQHFYFSSFRSLMHASEVSTLPLGQAPPNHYGILEGALMHRGGPA